MKVDGRDVREYTLENLRSGVSMVLQNGSLFSGTIADNLRWADPNATLAQMQAACAIARADEYIDRFPDGYDTVLEQNAANLSGGQRQRLLIARGPGGPAGDPDTGQCRQRPGLLHSRRAAAGAAAGFPRHYPGDNLRAGVRRA